MGISNSILSMFFYFVFLEQDRWIRYGHQKQSKGSYLFVCFFFRFLELRFSFWIDFSHFVVDLVDGFFCFCVFLT